MKRWKMTSKLLFLALFLVACSPQEQAAQDKNSLQRNILYFKDTRTGICFATYRLGSQYGAMTSVECTPEIQQTAEEFVSYRPSWK